MEDDHALRPYVRDELSQHRCRILLVHQDVAADDRVEVLLDVHLASVALSE
jgi:ACT domain-containing protein